MSPDALTAMEANLRFNGPETMFTRVFGRLTAWQNWIFQRPNAVGEKGALKVYGKGEKGRLRLESRLVSPGDERMGMSTPRVIRQHLIDPEICIRCNTCEATCPVGAITHDSRNYVVDAEKCNLCMACIPPCPTGSIDNWRTMPRADGLQPRCAARAGTRCRRNSAAEELDAMRGVPIRAERGGAAAAGVRPGPRERPRRVPGRGLAARHSAVVRRAIRT